MNSAELKVDLLDQFKKIENANSKIGKEMEKEKETEAGKEKRDSVGRKKKLREREREGGKTERKKSKFLSKIAMSQHKE